MNDIEQHDLENLIFSNEFFDDEVREGFFISSMIKRYWAAQFVVLREIDRVCRKHNIPWFADCGMLLGAVRHEGYVPWDDDLDICMLRHDWIRFFEVAEKELPEKYSVLYVGCDDEEEYDNENGRIVNSKVINCADEHLKEFYGCPYSVGVDIFPLDGISNDEKWEDRRCEIGTYLATAAKLYGEGKKNSHDFRELLKAIEAGTEYKFNRRGNIKKQILELNEELYKFCPSDKAEYVALMLFWVTKRDHKYSRDLFKDKLMFPYENIYIPVPARYDEVLRIEYGDYMQVYKGGGMHDYPIHKEQEAVYKERIGTNLYRFTLNKEIQKPERTSKPLYVLCGNIISALYKAHEQINENVKEEKYEIAVQLLGSCQSLSQNFEKIIQSRINDCKSIVNKLEDYYEFVFQCSNNWTDECPGLLDERVREIETEVERLITTKKRELLFLFCKYDWWKAMEPIYRKAVSEPDTDVYVISVPYQRVDKLTKIDGEYKNDGEFLPEEVIISTLEEYDIGKRHPDKIYIHYPYDEWCTTMDINNFFYSSNLREYTDKLVYLPPYDMDAPVDEEDPAAAAIADLIEQPALVYADEILLKSEGLKKLYIDTLVNLSGDREYWEAKVKVWDYKEDIVGSIEKETSTEKNNDQSGETDTKINIPLELSADTICFEDDLLAKAAGRKILVFRVNIAYILQHCEKAVKKMKDSIELMEKSSEKIICVFSPDVGVDSLKNIDSNLWGLYLDFIEELKKENTVIFDDNRLIDPNLKNVDAYYGCAGNMAHRCRNAGIPVMIMAEPE